jgi:hypothetical protein
MGRKRGSVLRRPVLYTVAVLLALGGGATAVFLRGSAQRRDDRAAIVAYESAVYPIVKEGGRVVQEEMKPSLRQFVEGEIAADELLRRAGSWRRAFEKVRSDVLVLQPPAFLRAIEPRWTRAFDAYLQTITAFEAVARAPASERRARLDQVSTAGTTADHLYDQAVELIRSHRRRLGLGPSPNFPEPVPGSS